MISREENKYTIVRMCMKYKMPILIRYGFILKNQNYRVKKTG